MDEPSPIGWTVSCQDFRGRAPGSREKLPPVAKVWFGTREEAEAHKNRLRTLNLSPDVLICVTPAKYRTPKPVEKPKPAMHGQMDWGSR